MPPGCLAIHWLGNDRPGAALRLLCFSCLSSCSDCRCTGIGVIEFRREARCAVQSASGATSDSDHSRFLAPPERPFFIVSPDPDPSLSSRLSPFGSFGSRSVGDLVIYPPQFPNIHLPPKSPTTTPGVPRPLSRGRLADSPRAEIAECGETGCAAEKLKVRVAEKLVLWSRTPIDREKTSDKLWKQYRNLIP